MKQALVALFLIACGPAEYKLPPRTPSTSTSTSSTTTPPSPSATAPAASNSSTSPQGCIAFRETSSCDAGGAREPCNDKECSASITSDHSGYCECGDKHVELDCGHATTTCASACGKAFSSTKTCTMWRHTNDFKADGPRVPMWDKPCDTWIATDWSGFCECGSKNVKFDSYHPPFTCATVCADIPVATATCGGPSGGGGGGSGGCTANSDCGSCQRCEVSTGSCKAKLSC